MNRPRYTAIPIGLDGLALEVEGAANGERFARIVASTWTLLPNVWRRRLLAHWRRARRTKPRRRGPRLVLCDRALETWCASHHGSPPLGMTCARGDVIRFAAPVLDRMPCRLVAAIVAHELAHVAQYAAGSSFAVSEPAEEEEVWWMTAAWGFPLVGEIEAWIDERVARWRRGLPIWR